MTNADSRAAGGRFRALYVMAHPDDEDAATLVWLARVVGVDVTVYSLTRGELGDNAIGTEMAEALGALRMGEMDAAARAYGVARVWFGGCFDYGYSKRLEEAWVRWGRSRVVGELALALRAAQPDVVFSRFRGDARDGHAHHQAVGAALRDALELAADASALSEADGGPVLARPHVFVHTERDAPGALRLALGGVRTADGRAVLDVAREGYVHHRSQVTERLLDPADDGVRAYAALHGTANAGEAYTDFFSGLTPRAEVVPPVLPEVEAIHRDSFTAATYGSVPVRVAFRGVPRPAGWQTDAGIAAPPGDGARLQVGSPRDVTVILGTGDCFPAALRALGHRVTTVEPDAFRADTLGSSAVVLGGVRCFRRAADRARLAAELRAACERGAHVVLATQTPEFDPSVHAPVPGTFADPPPEVCEEDASVRLLEPDHPLVKHPNRLDAADFDGWAEQRGSKFWSSWEAAYVPLVAMADTAEPEQRGAWLTTPVGAGRFTYCALALHRQLPFGVGGAYRILANLVA
ncbi:MAG: PIG-L family deacetylase [Polyangiales bacterium]|nr:PIG-L family deacetylase [Myxococcales bacterium]